MRRRLPVKGWAGMAPSRAKRRSVLRCSLINVAASEASMNGSAGSTGIAFGSRTTSGLSNRVAAPGTARVSGLGETPMTAFIAASIR